jgi:hypothetical protein
MAKDLPSFLRWGRSTWGGNPPPPPPCPIATILAGRLGCVGGGAARGGVGRGRQWLGFVAPESPRRGRRGRGELCGPTQQMC